MARQIIKKPPQLKDGFYILCPWTHRESNPALIHAMDP